MSRHQKKNIQDKAKAKVEHLRETETESTSHIALSAWGTYRDQTVFVIHGFVNYLFNEFIIHRLVVDKKGLPTILNVVCENAQHTLTDNKIVTHTCN